MQKFLEGSYLIAPFNWDDLTLAAEPVPPDDEDRELVEALQRLDQYMADGVDYGEWEDLFLSMKDSCCERFFQWLRHKGVEEYSQEFAGCVEVYLDFVYGYMHVTSPR